jgi:hypothetical protein
MSLVSLPRWRRLIFPVCTLSMVACSMAGRGTHGTADTSQVELPGVQQQNCAAPGLVPLGQNVDELLARGAAYQRSGQADSALAFYGHALQAQDAAAADTLCLLLLNTPVVHPSRGVDAEAGFTATVVRVLSRIPNTQSLTSQIHSAEDAMRVLEALLAHRRAQLVIKYSPPGLRVDFRRWMYRDEPNVLWETVFSDTVLTRPAAAYQFRYRRRDGRTVIVTEQCWNNCPVPPER